MNNNPGRSQSGAFYLMEHVEKVVIRPQEFALRVQQIAEELSIPHEWLMAVMYLESRFDPRATSTKGERAVGLIQFIPSTARSLGTSSKELLMLDAVQQLRYVDLYFSMGKDRFGPYQSFTDFYLALLYPKARGQDVCYTLFSSPSEAYVRHTELDENQDGHVSVTDIDQYLRRLFPTAYVRGIDQEVAE